MDKEEIYKRIMVCEKKERDFLEVGNTRTANRYHNEIQKWEELLNQLNPKMEKELNEYRIGYYKQKKVIDKIESLIKSKDNGTCIHNNERRGAYTFVLDFDEAREFIWELLQILEDKGK